jgi:glycosyltransferase involved in cell wall biosynthesis
MRILVLSDAYLPESTLNHAKMLHELAVEFQSQGHEVVVLTPGCASQAQPLLEEKMDDVALWRFRCRPTRGVSHYQRAINETLLSFYAYRALKKKALDTSFDIVVNYSPTIFWGPLAAWLKKQGAYVYLVLRDFFPLWAIDEGLIKRGSLVAKYFHFFEHLNYRSADLIAVQSPANVKIFNDISADRYYPVDVLYNWSASPPIADPHFGSAYLKDLGISDKFIFFYGGNIGHAQDIQYILTLAERFIDQPKAHFLIVGQGDQYNNISAQIKLMNLSNVTLSSSITQQQYRSVLTQVDVGIFTLAASHTAHNFPGKILGYLAAGLPILGAVNNGNDLIEVVNQSGSGKVSVTGNIDQFYDDAMILFSDAFSREQMSVAAHQLLDDVFSVENATSKILSAHAARKI